MLFKEVFPVVVSAVLLGPFLSNALFCSATDNAGSAFVINSLCCRSDATRPLLRLLADTCARHRFAVIAGHGRRHRNTHADELSHSLSVDLWRDVVAQVPATDQVLFHFAVADVRTGDCFVAAMSIPDLTRMLARHRQPAAASPTVTRRRRRRPHRPKRPTR